MAECQCSTGFTASNAIATRADLNDPNGTYANPYEGQADNVGIDSKVWTNGGTLFVDLRAGLGLLQDLLVHHQCGCPLLSVFRGSPLSDAFR